MSGRPGNEMEIDSPEPLPGASPTGEGSGPAVRVSGVLFLPFHIANINI